MQNSFSMSHIAVTFLASLNSAEIGKVNPLLQREDLTFLLRSVSKELIVLFTGVFLTQ